MVDTIEKPVVREKPVTGGWWQNAYVVDESVIALDPETYQKMPDGRYLFFQRYPTRDIAETERDESAHHCFACYMAFFRGWVIWDEAVHFKGGE